MIIIKLEKIKFYTLKFLLILRSFGKKYLL